MTDIRVEPEEARRIPALSLLLGFGPMLPFPAALLADWALPGLSRTLLAAAVLIWGGAILCFLAGVRRGLSFRTAGGARLSEIATMLWLFVLGLAAIGVATASALQLAGLWALLAGYASLGVLDFRAAQVGDAPPFFAKLRPAQTAIAVVSLGVLVARMLMTR